MILADTSAWVEYDRASGSRADRRIEELIADGGPLVTTEPVIMEVLAGARSDARESNLHRLLSRVELCAVQGPSDYLAAARIHRRCRAIGLTPRGLVHCLVAAVAWRVGASLLTQDVDLERIAEVVGIPLD